MKVFKKTKESAMLAVVIFGTSLLVLSCSKDSPSTPYVCQTCSNTPDALAVNDSKIAGVYKGIVVGSTGSISINIQNGSSTVTAIMVLDGITANLTSNVTVVEGLTYVAPFTGTYNGNAVTVTFQVGSGGADPIMVSSDIPGHPNAIFNLYKETSTSLISAFEGTYTAGSDSGTFNIVVASSLLKWGYVAKDNISGEINSGNGTMVGNHLLNEDGLDVGTITGDVVNGTSTNNSGQTVTINGNRTL